MKKKNLLIVIVFILGFLPLVLKNTQATCQLIFSFSIGIYKSTVVFF